MLKSKKFWSYESSQSLELKQEVIDNFKSKNRFYEDFNYFCEAIGVGPHPSLKQPYGKEHLEPSILTFISILVDQSTLKTLITILPYCRILTLKFSSNFFEVSNLEFLINSLLTKPNNVYNFILEWNNKIKVDGTTYDLSEFSIIKELDEEVTNNLIKTHQLIGKLATSTKLEALCLRGNLFGDDTAIILFENLKTNQNLKVLNLYKNNLTSKCIHALTSMLEVNKKLEEINMGGNHFTDEDFEMLKNYVGKYQMSHEEVENYNKKLKDREVIIEKNKKLKTQKKPEEPLPVIEEVTIIGDNYYISKNSTLKNLNIMQNLLTGKCLETLVSILEANPDLLITMDGNIFPKEDKDKLFDPFGKFGNRIYLTK